MRTTTWTDDRQTVVFNHHGDFSGHVKITYSAVPVEEMSSHIELPMEALEFIVAAKLRDEAIAELEDMPTDELLRRIR